MSHSISTLASAEATTPARRGSWKEICAAGIGNALEFYDLLIYGYFAVIISRQFFPAENETTSLLLSVATFAISFIMRPLGAVVLGSYTDRRGRKASLTLSIALIMIGTLLMTCVPTYGQIGLLAPLIVIVARMLQGFSSGGEFGACTAFMAENATEGRRGFFASWQLSTQGLATVFAAGVAAVLSYVLSPTQLDDWGWRLAFGIGLLIGPIGLYIRRQMDETPEFKALARREGPEPTPVRDLLKADWAVLLLCIGVVSGATAFNYVHKLYMPTYAMKQLHIAATSSFLGAFITGLAIMLMSPVFGILSDRFGRLRVLGIAMTLVGLSSYPLFLLLNALPAITTLLLVQALVGVLIAASLGPIPAMLSDAFPTRTRGSGLSLSYNFSVTAFGGFAPLVVTWMINSSGDNLAPSYYVMGTAALSLISILALTRTRRHTPV